MGVSGADFGALVEDLVWALDKLPRWKDREGRAALALGPMKGDIVEKGRQTRIGELVIW